MLQLPGTGQDEREHGRAWWMASPLPRPWTAYGSACN